MEKAYDSYHHHSVNTMVGLSCPLSKTLKSHQNS